MRAVGEPGLVSVIVPVHERPAQLREAVESALAQTWERVEVVVVDDASKDGTPVVARELARRFPEVVRVTTRAARGGAGLARNTGLEESRGEFLQFLDSDDLLLPPKLERQVELLGRHPECGVAYCRALRGADPERQVPSHRTHEEFDALLPGFLVSRGWPTLAPLWRRSACLSIGRFTGHAVLEDLLWDVRAGALGIRPCYCREDLCVVRDLDIPRAGYEPGGYTAAQWAAAFEVRREIAALLEASGLGRFLLESGFARSTFQMARQCAAAGHAREARAALELAASMPAGRRTRLQLAAFRGLAAVAGVVAAANVAEAAWRLGPGAGREARLVHNRAV